jgi:hypothetical protein
LRGAADEPEEPDESVFINFHSFSSSDGKLTCKQKSIFSDLLFCWKVTTVKFYIESLPIFRELGLVTAIF